MEEVRSLVMFMLAWLGLGLGVWLVDSAVRGRPPIATLKEIIQTGQYPQLGVSYLPAPAANTPSSEPPGHDGNPVAGTSASGTSATAPGGTVAGSVNPQGTHYHEGDTVPGSVAQWIDQAIAILKANGVPDSQLNRQAIEMTIEYESGGNPTIVNHYDSNAQEGHPSMGIMQDIQTTFDAHALPGYNDVYNPVDNIIASVRYAIATYGSLDNIPGMVSVRNGGRYKGY